MAPRANWKGFLKVGELVCPVALYTAASTSDRIAFHMLNRKTGHRLHREFIDSETGKTVEREDQVKGYEVGDGDYIALDPEEIAAALPESDKTLEIEAFIACDDIDDLYFDKPYYLTPSDRHGDEAFALIREGMKKSNVAALAETVLFRRMRTVLIRPEGQGLVATTLNYDYEVRSAEAAFSDVPDVKLKGEMLELAEHIINTKKGRFDPKGFDDRYDAALAEVVKAKIEGRKIKPVKPKAEGKVIDLMEALRQSAGKGEKPAKRKTKKPAAARKPAAGRRKAG
ncbi:Ku protein [Shinella sumterensis]|uniref:non-homologous end joining protein Ku n=1 Tax=Shinella sumterensis TaxID=1967501 RepID=UPI00106ED87A|nr:Ku protein [Shinella sumterensis]MCD1262569.1 Ku protein [Shinella sumterensis]TFF00078.1 Ku protein [Shinella sumterensis]